MSNSTLESHVKDEWNQATNKAREAAASVGEMASQAACAVGSMASHAACDVGKTVDDLTASAGTPTSTGSRIDVRSVSRVGKSDVGTNARRIKAYLARVNASCV